MFASTMRGTYISLGETAEMWSFCYVHIPKWLTAQTANLLFVSSNLTVYLLNRWRSNMRPKRYPYSKPQWEEKVSYLYWELSDEPVTTFVTYVNRLTGEVK